jgi:hypothetical protein
MTIKNIRTGNNTIQIKKFDIKAMPEHVTIVMIAKRTLGRSYMRDIPTTIAISKTEK